MSRSQRVFEDVDTIQAAATQSVKPVSLTTADASEVSVATRTKIQPALSVERLRETDSVDGDLAFSKTNEHDPYDTDNLDLFCDMIGRMGIGAKNDISSIANTWPAKPKKFESPTAKSQHKQEANSSRFPMTNLCDSESVEKHAHENDSHDNDSERTGFSLVNPKSVHESHKNNVDVSLHLPKNV
ncbi:hypothetical protein Daus18300_008261 [Diaporthe australafricana]|uniref:Uncharacterized protein n=1 Tax=Diaporthe australafricana TaxID=127596 RepID=A0ABR3WIX2_9PEZI